jgi:hypothetical protein
MKPTIEIIVSPDGSIQIDAVGFKGADCERATRYLEEALGAVNNRVKKPEHHQSKRTQMQQRAGA